MNFYTVVSKKVRMVIVNIVETRAIKLITLPIINNLFVYKVYKKVLYVMVES